MSDKEAFTIIGEHKHKVHLKIHCTKTYVYDLATSLKGEFCTVRFDNIFILT